MTPQMVRFSLSMFLIYLGISSLQFHSILLEAKGFSGTILGIVLMTGYTSALSAPFFIAWWSPKFQDPQTPLYFMISGAGITLPLLAYFQNPYAIVPTYFVHTFCVWCIFPLHMTFGMHVCRAKGNEFFFSIRSLGTLGFVVGCIIALFFVEKWTLQWVYVGLGSAFLGAFLTLFFPPTRKNKQALTSANKQNHKSYLDSKVPSIWVEWAAIYRDPLIRKLVLPIALISCGNTMAVSIQGNYLLHSFSGTKSTISMAWILCTGFEIPIMFLCAFLIKKWNISLTVILGVIGTFIRLGGLAFSQSLSQLFLFFTLHGFFYAGVITGLGVCLDKIHKSHHSAKQALFSLTYASIPSILGGFLSGFLWEQYSIQTVYWTAFGMSGLGTAFFIPLIPKFFRHFSRNVSDSTLA